MCRWSIISFDLYLIGEPGLHARQSRSWVMSLEVISVGEYCCDAKVKSAKSTTLSTILPQKISFYTMLYKNLSMSLDESLDVSTGGVSWNLAPQLGCNYWSRYASCCVGVSFWNWWMAYVMYPGKGMLIWNFWWFQFIFRLQQSDHIKSDATLQRYYDDMEIFCS